jgi:putative ABC transport system substrate-binding protein
MQQQGLVWRFVNTVTYSPLRHIILHGPVSVDLGLARGFAHDAQHERFTSLGLVLGQSIFVYLCVLGAVRILFWIGMTGSAGEAIKKILSAVFLLVLFHGFAEAGEKVFAVQSAGIKPYEEAFDGFKSVYASGIERIILSDSQEKDIAREISRSRPDLILAIGKDALSVARTIRKVPVVYAMVLNPESLLSGQKEIRGVSMMIQPKSQLMALRNAVPGIRNIGLLYDPEKSGRFVREARNAAARMGLTLIDEEVKTSKDVPSALMGIQDRIDSFWMVPDTTVITPETVEFLLLFSFQRNIPVLTFSEKYLSLGALIATGVDPFDMGAQAGEMAKEILTGGSARNARQAHARKMVVSTNLMIAGKLGINLNMAGNFKTSIDEKRMRSVVDVN